MTTLVMVLAVFVAALWFAGFCLADLARARQVRYLTRPAWAILIVITIPLGGLLYLSYGRPRTGGGGGALPG